MKYTYSGVARLGRGIEMFVGTMAFLLSTMAAVGIPVGAALNGDVRSALNLICFGLWFLIVGWTVGSLLLNGYPDIWIEDDHLTISMFLFVKARIRWSDVVDMRNVSWPLRRTVVRVRRITPFHRIIGWIYGRTILPSFAIRPEIDHYALLIQSIAARLQTETNEKS